MSVGINSAARRLCARAGWAITNLKIQKLLYLAQMFHLGATGQRLINTQFEAWDFGPVEPSLYRTVKIFGDKPIEDVFFHAREIDSATSEAQYLDNVCDQLANWTPAKLVSITHWSKGAWAKHYVPGIKGIIIPDQDIVDEYRARTAKTNAPAA